MSSRLSIGRRLRTMLWWPPGMALTSWHYMWRITPLHRTEVSGSAVDLPPPLPETVSTDGLQSVEDGVGPLFHRTYRVTVEDARLSAEQLIERLRRDPNEATPTDLARFVRVEEDDRPLAVNDELVVRMPGPWDGPVRVATVGPRAFRLATLAGHLEAGQIEFRARDDDGGLCFEIESWARSSDRLVNVLYHHLRMAKEIQLHMWVSFLEQIAEVAGGRRRGGIEIESRRVEKPLAVP